MFETFDEHARRVLFFARWSVTKLGGDTIDDVHLLLGVLTAWPQALTRFTDQAAWPAAALERRARELSPGGTHVAPSAEIPFSPSVTRRLLAVNGRSREPGASIAPEHLVWSLLQEPSTPVAELLAGAGVSVQAVEAFLDGGR